MYQIRSIGRRISADDVSPLGPLATGGRLLGDSLVDGEFGLMPTAAIVAEARACAPEACFWRFRLELRPIRRRGRLGNRDSDVPHARHDHQRSRSLARPAGSFCPTFPPDPDAPCHAAGRLISGSPPSRRLMQADRQRSDHKPCCRAHIALAAFGLVQVHRDAATMAARDFGAPRSSVTLSGHPGII
jgi:hypothetical protein